MVVRERGTRTRVYPIILCRMMVWDMVRNLLHQFALRDFLFFFWNVEHFTVILAGLGCWFSCLSRGNAKLRVDFGGSWGSDVLLIFEKQ